MDAAMSAASEGQEERIYVLQALAPKPRRRSGGAPRRHHQGQNFSLCTRSNQLISRRKRIPN
jgi:hypothetical protein